MHLLITKYSIPPLNKCMTFLAHGISVFFIRKIRARVRTHKNCVDKLKILDRLGEWRTGNSFFLFIFFVVPGLTRRKNYKVYKLTNQYPQRGGTKAVFGTCPSCCLTLISLRESSERTIWALHICSYIRRQSDNPASLLLGHGDFVIIFLRVEGDT